MRINIIMASFAVRMLSIFVFVALLLNITNYLFIRIHSPPRPISYRNAYSKSSSIRAVRRSLNPRYWSSSVECDDQGRASTATQQSNYTQADVVTDIYYLMFEKIKSTTEKKMENCPELPSGLGPELEDRSIIAKNLEYFETKSSEVKPGGIYRPTTCKPLHSVAIIIAYRGCKNYISTFLNIMHPFLIKQQLDYQIFVVEQSNKTQPYNRGKLLNVGFAEATRSRKDGFSCIILHEPHIVPMDSRNLYRCSWYPRQLATSVERPLKAPYVPLLGGAIAMTPEQFAKFNGFSNLYWGNDADYYDLYNRINMTNYYIENSNPVVGKYKTIRKGLALWHKSEFMTTPSPLYLLDGLTTLSYSVDSFELRRFYTYLQVNIDTENDNKMKTDQINTVLHPVTYETTPEPKTTENK
ncbi:beta-1,4-galactosyltransferase 1 [Helicoverpa armigera]|uniref:beta-1,4-galactosyltransferase 1 n=1 Tax=Helicoverpa armigera TaxID=29058 RepID=UPI003083C0AD